MPSLFNETETSEIYTLSLHDALPIFAHLVQPGLHVQPQHVGLPLFQRAGLLLQRLAHGAAAVDGVLDPQPVRHLVERSEEHTSELQSQSNLVCRLLLEKKTFMPEMIR